MPTTIGRDSEGSVRRAPLTRQLRRAARELARLRDGDAVADRPDSPPSRWEDDDYVYVEVVLPGSAGLAADISISAGRALIRIGR